MPLIFALLFFPLGLALGAALVINLIAVLGLTALIPPTALLPPPINAAIAPVVGVLDGGTLFALLVTIFLIIVVVFMAYAIASFALAALAPRPGLQVSSVGELIARGILIGLNCGLNLALLLSLIGIAPLGFFVASALVVINLLAAIPNLSNNTSYQTVLAYTTLFLPMAFILNLIGFVSWVINSGGFGAAWFPEWRRGNLVIHGGVTFANPVFPYNLANFTLLPAAISLTDPWVFTNFSADPVTKTGNGFVFHESGHTLNIGAFGIVYTLVGAVDQFLPMPWSPAGPLPATAYAELCAEGSKRDLSRNWIDLWTSSLAPPAPANLNAVASVTLNPGAGVVLVASAATEITVNCEINRGVSLDSTASIDPDNFPVTPIGRLWLRRLPFIPGLQAPLPVPLATGPAAFVFVPTVGGTEELEFWVTDGINGNPVLLPPLALPPAPASPPPPVFPDAGFRIHVTAIAAVITVPVALPAAGNLLTLDSALSTVVGTDTRTWRIETGPPSLLGLTATGNTFPFTPEVGVYGVSLTTECSVTDVAGDTVVLTDSATVNFSV